MAKTFLARIITAVSILDYLEGGFSFTQSPASSVHARGLLVPSPTKQWTPTLTARTASVTSLHMCICINCARVTNCSAYHFVEERHTQPHINKNPTWEPRNGSPTIQVHIRPDATRKPQNELEQLWEEQNDQTRLSGEAPDAVNGVGVDGLIGEKQYRTTNYEYDVVECEDFVLEKDAWVRNMPEEIRACNPDFVPT